MKCKKCKTENIMKADYCKACGTPFAAEEKEKAYNRTVFGIIDKILDLKSYITLDFITGSKRFKTGLLLVVILYSFLVLKINGNRIRILDSRDYDIEYNKTTKKYYLLTEESQIGLKLYIPEKTDSIDLVTLDKNNTAVNEDCYSTDEQVVLTYNENYHYIIQSGRQQLEMYVIME